MVIIVTIYSFVKNLVTALILSTVFGNTAEFWLNLQQRNELWNALNTSERRTRIEKAKPVAA